MDVLSSVLATAAVSGSVAATVRAGGEWGLDLSVVPGAAFHAVTSGTAFLALGDGPPTQLGAGDVVLLPRGTAHTLRSAPTARTLAFDHVLAEASLTSGGELQVGDSPATTQIVCASYSQDPATRLRPFDALPDVVHLPALATPVGLRSSLALIADELSTGGPGLRVLLDHAVNIVLVQVMKAWISDSGARAGTPTWLTGLADPTTGAALAMLHDQPAEPWTVSILARRLGVSRATLTRRFEAEVGQTPAAYLTAWRMDLASRLLRDGDDTVAVVARAVGYTSEYAFNRAFARRYGTPPGRYRATARSRAGAADVGAQGPAVA